MECPKCGGTDFYKSKQCKRCKKEYAKAYRENFPEKYRAALKAWALKNKEKKLADAIKWALNNPEKVKKSKQKWRDTHKEHQANYRIKNKDRYRERSHIYVATRRARKQTNLGFVSDDIVLKLQKSQKGKCVACKTSIVKKYHIDHIYPLSKGGSHDDKNLQLLCPTCNRKKNAKHPIDFMQEEGFLL